MTDPSVIFSFHLKTPMLVASFLDEESFFFFASFEAKAGGAIKAALMKTAKIFLKAFVCFMLDLMSQCFSKRLIGGKEN